MSTSSNEQALRSHRCGEITESMVGQQVRLAGWAGRIRDMGGVVFVDLPLTCEQTLRHSLPAAEDGNDHAVPVVELAGGVFGAGRVAIVRGYHQQPGEVVLEQRLPYVDDDIG